MEKSENIDLLAKALSGFQSEVKDIFKSKQGFKYTYADLSATLEATRPLLSKYGLCVSQLCEEAAGNNGDNMAITTMLMHESGQFLSSHYSMPIPQIKGSNANLTQEAGACVTYMRRYAYCAILGIAATDTDGVPEQQQYVSERFVETNRAEMLSRFYDLCANLKFDDKSITKGLSRYNVSRAEDLDDFQLNEVIARLDTLMRGRNE